MHRFRQSHSRQPMSTEREFRSTQLPTLPSKLATHHCNIISEKGNVISPPELSQLLDEVVNELRFIKDQQQQQTNLNDIVAVLTLVSKPTLIAISEENIFSLLPHPLVRVLRQWRRASFLSENDVLLFRNITKLLQKLFKNTDNINLYSPWLFNKSLLRIISVCLKDMVQSDKFFQEKNERELKAFTRLLDIYDDYQKLLSSEQSAKKDILVKLLDPIIHCLTSNYYTDAFQQTPTTKKTMTPREKFFLHRCPAFLTYYNGSRLETTMFSLLSTMLPRYITLFDNLMPSVQQWTRSRIRAVIQLLKVVNHGPTNAKVVATHLPFIDHVLTLIDTSTFYNNLQEKLTNPATILINAAINFLVNMVTEPAILAHIKQKHVTPSFLRLTSAQYTPLKNNVYTMLAYTTSEEDIKTMPNPGVLLSTVVTSLKTTVDQKHDDHNESVQLFETLKGLVQHDQMKEEILKQQALPFLLQCINKLKGAELTLLLEALWSLTFSQEVAAVLRTNAEFLQKIQTVSKIDPNEAVKKAADGLVWKLIREPTFLEKVARQEGEDEEVTQVVIGADGKQTVVQTRRASVAQGERTFQYDMMISYCHADKDLIIKIHRFLVDQGFKIWIDLDNMFGPAMSAMADAVENSEFVIMCMSDSYKQSTYCQAEAEYAFGCKRRLLPLIVRPGYKPDGWLGFMIGSRIYVDFGTYSFDISCDRLMNEISRQRKKPLPAKVTSGIQHEIPAPVPIIPAQVKSEKPIHKPVKVPRGLPDIYTKRNAALYFNRKPIDRWMEPDVLDFLFTHGLHELMPLCEKMDGRALIQLYKMCTARSNRTYTLLNNELKGTHHVKLPIGIYTRFLSIMVRLLSPLSPAPRTIISSPLPLSMASMASMTPARTSAMTTPIPPPEQHVSVQDCDGGYDILVTSNASTEEMFQMIGRMGPQIRAIEQGRRQAVFA